MSTKEVGEELGLTSERVRQLCKEGVIPHYYISERSLRVKRSDLYRWLASIKVPARR